MFEGDFEDTHVDGRPSRVSSMLRHEGKDPLGVSRNSSNKLIDLLLNIEGKHVLILMIIITLI